MVMDVSLSIPVLQLAVLFSVLLLIHMIVFYRARRDHSSSPDPESDTGSPQCVIEKASEERDMRKNDPVRTHWARVPYAQKQRSTPHETKRYPFSDR